MLISKLIAKLQTAQTTHGDHPVYFQGDNEYVYLEKAGSVVVEAETVEYPDQYRSKFNGGGETNCIRVDIA